ncbi:MAG: transglutaminase family protein [Rhodocyclaceae bacterium]|nr:transglutaminase family protein [Rhodocyclaceae bacterium]
MNESYQGPDRDTLAALRELDARIEALGTEIWVGAEPTFTDRHAESAEWLHMALGGEKERRAGELLRDFSRALPGCAFLRTLGRQYPGEARARWSFGVLARRDGCPIWEGPPDPLIVEAPCPRFELETLRRCLIEGARGRGWAAESCALACSGELRLLIRIEGGGAAPDSLSDQLLGRPSLHAGPIPPEGLRDELAEAGILLLLLDALPEDQGGWPAIELPAVFEHDRFCELLGVIGRAASAAGLTGLVLRGHPPPVDGRLQWTSLTPDPAVIEANLAPATSLQEFYRVNAALFAAADNLGLYPCRLHYNGGEADSGGGGQLTLGGPTAQQSPFFLTPHLLPRLVRYFNRHPALSYWQAPDSIGSGSQAPRADEGPQERRAELEVAIEQIERRESPTPEFIWASLAPFLADSAGNSHRSELNIEKLWNPYLGARGLAGLVEFRAFRMAQDAETLSAEAALLRSVVARLACHPFDEPLVDWGSRLHDQFALPWYLAHDLREVFADLDRHGLALGEHIETLLLDDSRRELRSLDWAGLRVRVLTAQEFWPLIGDVTTQQPSDSRLVDASTQRIELRICAHDASQLEGLVLRVNDCKVPLRVEADGPATLGLAGIRYRSFVPLHGLHPQLPAMDRIELVLTLGAAEALRLTLFNWHPRGEAYEGLPRDREEARRRRAERVVVEALAVADLPEPREAPSRAYGEYCFDLRRL